MTRIRKAVFPVAGLGTRFLPATKTMPKEMLPVVDKPLIQYAVEEAAAAGIEHFIFVTGRGKAQLEDHFDHAIELETTLSERGKSGALAELASWRPRPGQISYTRQQRPLGLGHAVLCARALVGDAEPFAVLLPDDLVQSRTPCLRQLLDAYARSPGTYAAVMDVPRAETSRYGVLDVAFDDGRIATARGLVEKPRPADAPSTLSIIGRYVLDVGIFEALEGQGRGAGGEIQLTDALQRLIDAGRPFHGVRFEGRRYDCGDKAGWLEANIALALDRPDLAPAMTRILQERAPQPERRAARARS